MKQHARPIAQARRAARQRRALTFAAYLFVLAVGIADAVLILALPTR